MRDSIQPDSPYFLSSSCGRVEVVVPGQAILDLSASGPVDDAAEYWSQEGRTWGWGDVDPRDVARDLAEYGAWDEEDLKDEDLNRERFLWTAACSVAEEAEPDEHRVIHSVLWGLKRGDGPGHLADLLAAGVAFLDEEAAQMLAALDEEEGDVAASCRVALAYDDRTGLEGLGFSIRN
jgi:hypothetical protein